MRLGIIPGILLALTLGAQAVHAQEVNCANEFRSGKLYFAEGQKSQAAKKSDTIDLYQKAVARFAVAVEVCPDKCEYHSRYAMALGQLAGVYLEDVLITLPREERDAMIDSVFTMYELAGTEFDQAYDCDDSKSNLKFVRENREYYWVQRYNGGIKRIPAEEPNPDYEGAIQEFRLALLVDPRNLLIDEKANPKAPRNVKAYNQGAIALINWAKQNPDNVDWDKMEEAAQWVQKGLELDPANKQLNEIRDSIYQDVGQNLVMRAEEEKDASLASQGVEYLTEVLERRGGEDANVLFEIGMGKLALSSILAKEDSVAAGAAGMEGAAAFDQAAALVEVDWDMPNDDSEESQGNESNKSFYLAAKYNQIQCLLNAGAYDEALTVCREYLSLDCANPQGWLVTAQVYSFQDAKNQAVSALMASKSIQAGELPVADAQANAQGEEASAYSDLGGPTFVFSYQDSEGNQINTAIWCKKKQLRNYILGDEVGKIEW